MFMLIKKEKEISWYLCDSGYLYLKYILFFNKNLIKNIYLYSLMTDFNSRRKFNILNISYLQAMKVQSEY